MRFGLFYEHQLPRPWEPDSERGLMAEALEQVELADRLGLDCIWTVEHHFLEEYSHSSAPEVFLAAASQRTERIRLGHGVVQLPPAVNHPARVAERIATLDLVSGGRVEFGTGESSSAAELGGFGVERERKREQWHDAIDAITRMFVEEPFAGWDSPWLRMPPRNVVPKPVQRPHPPLWVACSRRETIHLAARSGVGALSFAFAAPEDAARWVREYHEILAGPDCRPVGFSVNPSVAVVLPMMCHSDEKTALTRGMAGARFFGFSLAHYYGPSAHHPARTNLGEQFAASGSRARASRGDGVPLGARVIQAATGSARGAIGTPAQLTELLGRYEEAGVDQVIFIAQAGGNRHEHICESLELFAGEVMPAFAERREIQEAARSERLAPVIAAALARRDPPRSEAAGYRIDEAAELQRARERPPRPPMAVEVGRRSRAALRRQVRHGASVALARAVRGRSDAQVESLLRRRGVQRALLAALARAYRPSAASGFSGDIVLVLTTTSGERRTWTVSIAGDTAGVAPGDSPRAALRLRVPVVLAARAAAGELRAAELAAGPDLDAEGDLGLVSRLGEMFGGRSPY